MGGKEHRTVQVQETPSKGVCKNELNKDAQKNFDRTAVHRVGIKIIRENSSNAPKIGMQALGAFPSDVQTLQTTHGYPDHLSSIVQAVE